MGAPCQHLSVVRICAVGKQEFADYISARRTKLNISPAELAKKLGRRSRSVVYDLESGAQDATIEDINILARELDESVENLLLIHGARLNPPDAARLPHDVVEDLLAIHRNPDYWKSLERAVRGLRRDLDDLEGQP
jgi:transcriptional regulator with XRE-family HTH domain